MAETYHGVEIPEDIWRDWVTPFEETARAFRMGVRGALKVDPDDRSEEDRLDALAKARDEAEQRAFEEENKDQPWMQRRLAFRKLVEEKNDD